MTNVRPRAISDGRRVVVSRGAASLWTTDGKCVFPYDDPNLFNILRAATFTRKDQGTESGQYLYLVTQR